MVASVTASVALGASAAASTTIETASFSPTGSNKIIYALVGCGATSPGDPNSVKYASTGGTGGEAMTLLDSVRTVNTNVKTSIWKLANPSASSGTIWAQYASSNDERWIIAVAVQDASGENTIAYATANAVTTATVNATSTTGELVLDFLSVLDGGGTGGSITVGAGQTSIKELEGPGTGSSTNISAFENAGISQETASGTPTTMSWTMNVGMDYGIHAFQVLPAAAGPTINTHPQNSTVYQGQTANFTISATGTGTLHYQWKDDGSNVGTDSNSYTTAATVLGDNGAQITCVVTDDNGNATSNAATLTVIPTASIAWLRG